MNNNDIDEIVNHIYISNWDTSNNPSIYFKNDIKLVITLETRRKPDQIIEFYDNNNIKFIYLYIEDSHNANIYDFFDDTYNIINNYISHHQNVLVHCYAGVSRSSTIILNYMIRKMFERNKSLKNKDSIEIVNYVLYLAREKRNIINPNNNFLNQLVIKTEDYKKHF
jgi:dual specificity phosphatase 12